MPELFQWKLVLRHGTPTGVGIVSGHPKMMDGIYVHTSPLLHAEEMDGCLVLETASGRTYHVRLEGWDNSPGQENPLPPKRLGLPPDFWTRCAQSRETFLTKKKADWKLSHPPGTLILSIVGTTILSAFWIVADSSIRDIDVKEHLGMFQDSYIINDSYENALGTCQIDFRLFPKWNRLEPYQISGGLEQVVLINEGDTDVTFGTDENQILCEAKTNVLISKELLVL